MARTSGRIVSTYGFPIVLRYDRNQHGRLENDDLYNLFTTDAPYTQLFDYAGGSNVVYLGRATPGSLAQTAAALWQIRKFAYDGAGSVLSVAWAAGTAKFNQVWDNRAALAYS